MATSDINKNCKQQRFYILLSFFKNLFLLLQGDEKDALSDNDEENKNTDRTNDKHAKGDDEINKGLNASPLSF